MKISDDFENSLRAILEGITSRRLPESAPEKRVEQIKSSLERIKKHCDIILNDEELLKDSEGVIFFIDHLNHSHRFISAGDRRNLLSYSAYINARLVDAVKDLLLKDEREHIPQEAEENNVCDNCGENHD